MHRKMQKKITKWETFFALEISRAASINCTMLQYCKQMRPLSLSLFQFQINQITLAQFPISGTDKLRPGIMLMRVISTIVISIPRTNPITAQKVKEQDERTTKR